MDLPTSSLDLVKALDLYQATSEDAPLPQRKWGVISSALLTADGAGVQVPDNAQVGVLSGYGSQVSPRKGGTMVALSSGTARDPGDPGHVYPQNGLEAGQVGNFNGMTQTSAPPDYLQAHGGTLPSAAACPPCTSANCSQSFDSVNLKVRIRVPTNARSFSYNFKFYSAEFPEFLCGNHNDFFVTLLTSKEPTIPLDKNIAFDSTNSPVSVNNAFFQVCFPPMGSPPGTCPGGTLELVGTGMGGWGSLLTEGGGTAWLTNDAPVVPGETIELEFIIWDAGDHNVDSLVLLDKFRWNITPSAVQVHN
ncbi:choice-of-anchor L domain-containing protein [Sorangium sp. So ce1128]